MRLPTNDEVGILVGSLFFPFPWAEESGKNRDRGNEVGNCVPVFFTETCVEETKRGALRDFSCKGDLGGTHH